MAHNLKNADTPINGATYRQCGENDFRVATEKDIKEGLYLTAYGGLTKREYFAGQVLSGLMVQSIPGQHNQNTPQWNKERAKFCIDMADELLKQLEE